MFLVKPDELKTLERVSAVQLSDLIQTLTWTYIPWRETAHLNHITSCVMLLGGAVKSSLIQAVCEFETPSNVAFDVRQRLELPFQVLLLKGLQHLRLADTHTSVIKIVYPPDSMQLMLALGTYKPIFQEFIEKA